MTTLPADTYANIMRYTSTPRAGVALGLVCKRFMTVFTESVAELRTSMNDFGFINKASYLRHHAKMVAGEYPAHLCTDDAKRCAYTCISTTRWCCYCHMPMIDHFCCDDDFDWTRHEILGQ